MVTALHIDINKIEKYYCIKNNGIYSTYTNKYLRPYYDKDGYVRYSLTINKKIKGYGFHRIIATKYIKNIDNKPFINHKNGIKDDNRIENLEWCTGKENTDHAYATGLIKNISDGKYLVKYSKTRRKFNKKDIIKIIELGKSKSRNEIASIYGVTKQAINKIFWGKSYKEFTCLQH